MSLYRMSSRLPRTLLAHRLNSLIFCNHPQNNTLLIPSNRFHSLLECQNKLVVGQTSPLHILGFNSSAFQKFGFSSSTPSETAEKENSDSVKEGNDTKNIGAAAEATGDVEAADQKNSSSSKGQQAINQKELSDSDSSSSSEEEELTMEDLIKLVNEKEELLKVKHKEFKEMQDKVIRAYADMENARDRTRREAENSKKFAIQSFAKSLLDVADNLGRASSVVKESFSKIDMPKDSAGAAPLLKTLLEGVEMTEKQLTEVFKKFGVEKYDPTNEQFDPNRHNAVFQVPDASKPPGTVAVVLKSGYVLHDRVIRPAEVGVTESSEAVENKETDQGSKE